MMEASTKTERLFKYLKVSKKRNGQVVNESFVPDNAINRSFFDTRRKQFKGEFDQRYCVEKVQLTVEQAAAIGDYEAYTILNPPKASRKIETNDLLAKLMEQNATLIRELTESKMQQGDKKPKTKE